MVMSRMKIKDSALVIRSPDRLGRILYHLMIQRSLQSVFTGQFTLKFTTDQEVKVLPKDLWVRKAKRDLE